MTKGEFMQKLAQLLEPLSEEDREKTLSYYLEMIDDSMEEGLSEEDAVSKLESPEEIARKIKSESSLEGDIQGSQQQNHPHHSTSRKNINTILLILGFPLWFPLMMVFLVLTIVAYILIWIPIVVLGAVFIACAVAAIASVASGCFLLASDLPTGLMALGGALACGGLAIFTYCAVFYAARGLAKCSAWLSRKIKSCFKRKAVA